MIDRNSVLIGPQTGLEEQNGVASLIVTGCRVAIELSGSAVQCNCHVATRQVGSAHDFQGAACAQKRGRAGGGQDVTLVIFETKHHTKECVLKRLEEAKGVGRSSASFRALPCSDLEERNSVSLGVQYLNRMVLTLMCPG